MKTLKYLLPLLADAGFAMLVTAGVSVHFHTPVTVPMFLYALFAAYLPDIDNVDDLLEKKIAMSKDNLTDHRDGLHYPILWILGFAFLILIFGWSMWTAILSVGVMLHFINDTYGTGFGIKWLYPFSKRSFKFAARKNPENIGPLKAWTPKEKNEHVRKWGNPNWIDDIYLTANHISIVDYSLFFLGIVALVSAIL